MIYSETISFRFSFLESGDMGKYIPFKPYSRGMTRTNLIFKYASPFSPFCKNFNLLVIFCYLFLFILLYKFCLLWSWIITPANDATRYHQIFLIRKSVRHTEVQEYSLGQHPPVTARHGVKTNERQSILEIKFDSNAEKVLWIGKLFYAHICISNVCNINVDVTYLPKSLGGKPSVLWKLQSMQIRSECMIRTSWNE